MTLDFSNIYAELDKTQILKGASLTAADGQITGIIGPNGSGKSTLVKTLFGIVPSKSGDIMLGGALLTQLSRKEVAQCVAYVGQESANVFDFTVYEVVAMALYGRRTKRPHSELVLDALRQLHLEQLAERSITTLSGGERKMVYFARAVAQNTDTMVLDEPTNHLDIRRQLFLMNFLKRSGKTILIVLHDLDLAAHFCDSVALLQDGCVLAQGAPHTVLTAENVQRVFGVCGSARLDEHGRCRFELDLDSVP